VSAGVVLTPIIFSPEATFMANVYDILNNVLGFGPWLSSRTKFQSLFLSLALKV